MQTQEPQLQYRGRGTPVEWQSSSTRSLLTGCTHLDLAECVEAVHLVEQLQHGALDLTLASAVAVVALRANRVNLVCGTATTQAGRRSTADRWP
jgi:hypothetical protein